MMYTLALAALAIAPGASAQVARPAAGIIQTISGNGLLGFSGDGGPALKASFGWLTGIAVDPAGNIFVVDGDRIRSISASTGSVHTIATVHGASAIGIDTAGNLYISSQTTIRKIAMPNAAMTTIAGLDGHPGSSGDGGPASQAELNRPSKVATDTFGNLYFTDRENQRIRKIATGNGLISTIAGTGAAGFSGDGGPASAAQLNDPADLAIDPLGNLLIEDAGNYRIRKLTVSSGIITTVAGTGTFGFSGDGGPALNAQFSQLAGIALDSTGNLYLADYNNNRVRVISASTGIISTIAGTGVPGISGDAGPAISAELQAIFGIAIDHNGYLYILNSGVGITRAVGPGAAQQPSSVTVTLASSDPKPRMGEFVTLTTTVTSNLGLPAHSGTVTWYKGSEKIGTANLDESGTATYGTILPDAGQITLTASYAGTLSGYDTLSIPVFGYTLGANLRGPVNIAAGNSAQVMLTLNAYQSFVGAVDLSCDGLPGPAYCEFSKNTVNLSNSASEQSLTLTVHTRNPAVAYTRANRASTLLFAVLCPILFLVTPAKRLNSRTYGCVLLTLSLGFVGTLVGCSGSVNQIPVGAAPSANSNTLGAGTYAISVNAASGRDSVKLPVTIVIQ